MRLSTRNQFPGTITSITEGGVMAIVKILLDGTDATVTSAITVDGVKSLGLKVGDKAYALVKSTEVQVAVD